MIQFKKVSKIYPPNIIALNNISFSVKKGEFVCIAGRSGAGKTSLLKLLFAEEKPTHGQVFFEDCDIFQIKKSKLFKIRRRIGVVFQDYKLLPQKTVYENISYVLEAIGIDDDKIKEKVNQVLEIVELEDKINNFPYQLSGGEKQRVAVARAIVHQPEVVLADEPTGNLDPYNTRDIIRILKEINKSGTTVILATHSKEIINNLEKRVITLEEAKIVRDEEKGRFTL